MMGQIIQKNEPVDSAENKLIELGKTKEEAKAIIDGIPQMDEDMIKSFVNIMTICASYLTLSNSVVGEKSSIAQLTMRYLSENFNKRISIADICNAIGYSKSTVLTAFKKEYSTTINTYLTELRLETAKKLLLDNEITVNEIASYCGFSDQSYFSKVFSAKYGVTPTDYRKGEQQ
jgi:AraC-like DNA-binding protein